MHNQSEIPFTVQNIISIPPGLDTYVGVNRRFISHLESPYSNCQKDLEHSKNAYLKKLFEYFISLGVNYYDQDFCFTLCYQDKLLTECGCIDIISPKINNALFCSTDNQSICLSSFKYAFQASNIANICYCPQQCEMIKYDARISNSEFPTHNYHQLKKL